MLGNQHFKDRRRKDLLKRYEKFSLIISEIHKSIVKISSEAMRKYGLQGASAHILLAIHRTGACTAAALARSVDKNKSEISRVLVDLEKKGFIEKENRETNYRVTLRLTPVGERAALGIENAAISTVMSAGNGVSDEDRATMYACLDLISKNLQTICNEGLLEEGLDGISE